ncbi:hypothetical protein ACSBR2_017558 [Camellia fascicularis]
MRTPRWLIHPGALRQSNRDKLLESLFLIQTKCPIVSRALVPYPNISDSGIIAPNLSNAAITLANMTRPRGTSADILKSPWSRGAYSTNEFYTLNGSDYRNGTHGGPARAQQHPLVRSQTGGKPIPNSTLLWYILRSVQLVFSWRLRLDGAVRAVGTYFVGQYYQVLLQQLDFVHQFYSEASTMLRIDGNSRETATAMLANFGPGGENLEFYFRAVSSSLFKAALNTKRDKIQRLFGQREGIIIKASEEQIKATTHREEGSMTAPYYNSRATKIAVRQQQRKARGGRGSHQQQRRSSGPSYQKVSGRLSRGVVFIVPPGHPVITIASKNQNLQIVCFDVNALNNEKFPLAEIEFVLLSNSCSSEAFITEALNFSILYLIVRSSKASEEMLSEFLRYGTSLNLLKLRKKSCSAALGLTQSNYKELNIFWLPLMVSLLFYLSTVFGSVQMLKLYGVPYMIFVMWLDTVTCITMAKNKSFLGIAESLRYWLPLILLQQFCGFPTEEARVLIAETGTCILRYHFSSAICVLWLVYIHVKFLR